jgi:murein DD-endopeptidase MepM/ murein hydrolase activator NlpD
VIFKACLTILIAIGLVLSPKSSGHADEFRFDPPGALVPNSGTGAVGNVLFLQGIRFPVEVAPAYANSQVYGIGGMSGPWGSQCSEQNYRYPWHDNFCEKRSWDMPLCPSGKGHQGQDIRPATCEKDKYWAVAVEDGRIAKISRFTVTLFGNGGTLYRYLHLNSSSLQVHEGSLIKRGDRIGLISNNFGDAPTTIHLHFEAKQMIVDSDGNKVMVFVPPYASLAESYKMLLSGNP